jgi:hypothetical protein
MQLGLRALAVISASFLVFLSVAQAQTSGVGSVTISGLLRGPIYPCGNSTCPTYDSGKITITVNGFNAVTNYSHTTGQSTSEALAKILVSQLNTVASPVTAARSNGTISITAKLTGAQTNYPLSTLLTHSTLFERASFTAARSGATLTTGTGGPVPVGTLVGQTSNNTSVCSSSNDAGGNRSYCTAFFNGFNGNNGNWGSQTDVPNSPAGHISNISTRQLLYPGWNGRMICEYQPWFGLGSHKSVGYNQNSAATVAAQDSFMIAEGCDINLIDFYGALDPNQAFNLRTTNTVFSDLNARSGYPLKLGILEDKGALKSTCPTSGQTASGTVSCLKSALIKEMDYIHTHYTNSGVYWTDGGRPVIGYFGGKSDWPILTATDWDAVWVAVKAHTDTYAVPFKFIFQFGAFTTASYDNGRYGWVQPPAYSSSKQFWWGSVSSGSPTYLDTLYNAGLNHPSQLTIGALYKGFDDNNSSWSGNRVVAQQCGQVLLKTASHISNYFGGAKPQIPYVQVMTWNDYEEGTAVENGIDNCYTVNSSLTGNLLNWSLVASDLTYASTSTVHHFNVYYADARGNLYSAASNLPVSTRSLDLSSRVPPGTWNIYVEMVGQPLIINRMANAVTLIH